MNFWSKIKHFIFYGLGGASASLSGILILPILTKSLTVEEFGAYSMVILCGSLASSIFYFGISSAMPRFYFDQEANRSNVLSTAALLISLGAILQTLMGFAFSSKLSFYLFKNGAYATPLFLTFAGYALLFLNQFIIAYWRLIGAAQRVFVWALINILINFCGIYLGFHIYGNSVLVPVVVFIISQILQLSVALFQSKEILGTYFDKELAHSLIKFGSATVIIAMGTLAIDWFDRFVVNSQLTLKDVAVYSLAYKVGTLINIVFVVPFVSVWNPLMLEKRSSPDVKKLFFQATDIYISAGVCCTVFAALFFKDVVFLFVPQKDYSDLILYFPFLMLGTLIYGLSNIFSAGFIFSKKLKGLTIIYLGFAAINISLTLVFVKSMGLSGAVLSSFLTYLFLPFAVYAKSRHYFNFSFNKAKVLGLIAACLLIIYVNARFITVTTLPTFLMKSAFFVLFTGLILLAGLKSNGKSLRDFLN